MSPETSGGGRTENQRRTPGHSAQSVSLPAAESSQVGAGGVVEGAGDALHTPAARCEKNSLRGAGIGSRAECSSLRRLLATCTGLGL
jgi:hypothetical protein